MNIITGELVMYLAAISFVIYLMRSFVELYHTAIKPFVSLALTFVWFPLKVLINLTEKLYKHFSKSKKVTTELPTATIVKVSNNTDLILAKR